MKPLIYAQIAQKAYTHPPDIGFEDSSSRAIVTYSPDGKVIAFPGTNNHACWLADLDVWIKDIPGMGYVHAGFWQTWEKIANDIKENIAEEKVVLVGHSLGGAIAILAGAALCLAGRPPKAVFAFEPPRVSIDRTIGDIFANNHVEVFLYRNGFDVVPMVPRLLHSWQHCGPLIEIGTPSLQIMNIEDHEIQRVIEALK